MLDETPSATRVVPFEFRGSGSEYFRIWIVNLLLTIVTLGIYSAWAKVRRVRYFYGSTRLDGHAFDYHASPIAILKGRLIALGLYIAYAVVAQIYPEKSALALIPFAFALPWVIMRSRKFHMRMSSWRGLRFDFHGDYKGALVAYVGWLLAAIATLYILFPVYLRKRIAYVLDNSAYGTQRLRLTTSLTDFWQFCISTAFQAVLLLLGVAVATATLFGAADRLGAPEWMLRDAKPVALAIALSVAALAVAAYYSKSSTNAAFDYLEIGPHFLKSRLETGTLLRLYLKNFALIVLTLGFYYPWAKVATVRYQLDNTALLAQGDLDDFRAEVGAGGTATGEEISDFFDVDFGL